MVRDCLAALKDADGAIFFTRFLALPKDQMKHIDDYLNRAGPVVGLRTATHGFNYKDDKDPAEIRQWALTIAREWRYLIAAANA